MAKGTSAVLWEGAHVCSLLGANECLVLGAVLYVCPDIAKVLLLCLQWRMLMCRCVSHSAWGYLIIRAIVLGGTSSSEP